LRGGGLRVVLSNVDLLDLGRGGHCDRFSKCFKADVQKKICFGWKV